MFGKGILIATKETQCSFCTLIQTMDSGYFWLISIHVSKPEEEKYMLYYICSLHQSMEENFD
jgi:hypothetical protein